MEREYNPLEWFDVIIYLKENADIDKVKEDLESTGRFLYTSHNTKLRHMTGEMYIGENSTRSEESLKKLEAVAGVKSIDHSYQRLQWGTAAA